MKVVLDPGHGGRDPGAVGPAGLKEKDITLAVAKKTAPYLAAAGLAVVFTRDSDRDYGTTDQDIGYRARQIVNQSKAEVCVSIHCNSFNAAAHGIETYHHPAKPEDQPLAKSILDKLIAATGLVNRGVKTANFGMIRLPVMPSCLVELLFISNPAEEQLLADELFQDKCAQAIAHGIAEFLGMNTKTTEIIIGAKMLDGTILADNLTYAPVRAFGEALGYPVVWDPKAGVSVGGVKIDVTIIDGVAYAPIRLLAEIFGKTVNWDGVKVVLE